MATFTIPTAAQFATWHESARPELVIRLMCNNDHVLTEWWRTSTGEEHPWGGRSAEFPDLDNIVSQQAIASPDGSSAHYWRWVLECRPTDGDCKFRRVLRHESLDAISRVFDSLAAGETPDDLLFAHPSGGVALKVQADNIFGHLR